MTQDQQVAMSHWSMFAVSGFPIRKVGNAKWIISVDSTSLWAVIGTRFPIVFKTKTAAQEFFNNLCLQRFREWR